MLKKSQIAMESVLVYGLVILVVTLAIGALVYFGVLDLGRFLPDSCKLSGEGLTCENYAVQVQSGSNDNIKLEFRNQVGKNIDIKKVAIVGVEDMAGMWGSTPCEKPVTLSVVNGALSSPVSMKCTLGIPAGKKIKGTLTVTYQIIGSAIDRTATGTIQATVAP
ncbi:hypothetical protein J4212_00880 [Candidatus Woesearchaeota archaeon]|nr:hypothetical protein [Candidatus Woesearchaeota archaeon]